MKKYNLKNPSQNKCQIENLSDIYEKYFGFKKDGTFVEVGAFDGISWSNTFGLAVLGWKGLFFEPQPNYFQECVNNYSAFEKIKVINSCVGKSTGKIKLYTGYSLATTDLDSLKEYEKIDWFKGILDEKRNIETNLDTLDNFLTEEKFEKEFDLLVIDVEGAEYDVLQGFTISEWKPKMVIIELHEENEHESLKKNLKEILYYFEKNNYLKVYKDENNSIFFRNDLLK
jgi:FkbM family methyltransferase